jgi:3-oxoacyl-[acyl-carrier-protein] synthase-1
MGVYSCIGKDSTEVAASLYAGKSGIILEPERKAFGYRSGLSGYVPKPDLKPLLDRRARIMLPEQGEYAYMATREALQMAFIDQDYLDTHETGIVFGNDSTAQAVVESMDIIRQKKNTLFAGSGAVFQTMNSTVNNGLYAEGPRSLIYSRWALSMPFRPFPSARMNPPKPRALSIGTAMA